MGYATPQDLIERYDQRALADLASDDGAPDNVLTSTRLSAALDSASGYVDAACQVGQVYSADDLAGLTGNARALLVDLVCELAMVRLMSTRLEKYGNDQVEGVRKRCEEYLDRLRKGERLFPLSAQCAAGTATIDGPTAVDYERLNLLPDRTRRYYPSRARRLPIGRG